MATIRPEYYVLWNTDEGARYYEAQKEKETNTLIYVKYADGTNSYFKQNIVNKTTNDEGLIKVISSDVWYGARDLMFITNSSPPSNGNQVAAQPQEGSGRKRKKKTRKMKGGHHLYKRLGVSKYASQKQIKKAYNKLKKKKKLTKKVKHAYKILSKKKTRKQYNNRYRKVMKHKRHTRKKRGGNVWKLKEEYETIMNKYDHDIFWINNAHKGQKAARKFKNVWRKFAGKTKPKNEAQAKVQRNTKLEALKEKAWKLCKPVKEKFEKIKKNVKVALSGEGNLTLELQNGEFVDIEPKSIQQWDRPDDWNDWTAKLMNEFQREQDRLEAEMHKSGLYGVCDIYDEIEKKLREDEDKENNPHQVQQETRKQQDLNKNLRTMGLQGY